MKFFHGGSLPISWVDLITLIVICGGIVRGRKRGLSEELLDTIQWLIIVIGGAYGYSVVAQLLGQRPVLGQMTYNILSYLLIALVVKIVFVICKRHFGQKIVESDMFGGMEYYGGMAAGAVRWTCVYFFCLSMLHAPVYTPEELAARKKAVDYNFGSDFFPSGDKIQAEVFTVSLTGKNAHKYLAPWMLAPTSNEIKALRNDNSMAKRRERNIDALMGGK